MNFKVRKQGYDLKDNKNYNKWDGEINPFFPEFVPKLVGGTASSLAFKDTKETVRGMLVVVYMKCSDICHLALNIVLMLSTGELTVNH